ncbi:hypothetical protein E2C01_000400 [Portunus trituberculatus]|uniref:Uncharacterized protein n=1 Tax=Portunus trituberculatus TaxID=210409 RepID=A0A5B7CJN3_PORTR|nr:hypothetical protein [Portunus trituberculatus]
MIKPKPRFSGLMVDLVRNESVFFLVTSSADMPDVLICYPPFSCKRSNILTLNSLKVKPTPA